eukprot:UN00192
MYENFDSEHLEEDADHNGDLVEWLEEISDSTSGAEYLSKSKFEMKVDGTTREKTAVDELNDLKLLEEFHHECKKLRIKTKEDLYKIRDDSLVESGVSTARIKKWREKIQYTRDTWQRDLYICHYQDYVKELEKT